MRLINMAMMPKGDNLGYKYITKITGKNILMCF